MGIVLKHSKVALDALPQQRSAAAGAGGSCSTRKAELVRVDGTAVAIEVTCSCGEVTLVEFVDPAAPTSSGAAPGTGPNTPNIGGH